MERLKYREIVEKLAKIDRDLSKMGLNQHDRICRHQRNITKLADALEEGRLEKIAVQLPAEQRREILWSFVESVEFTDAMDALRGQGYAVPKGVLERALKGPADLYLEDEKSNQGRNKMFEITIAGRAAFAGLKPQLGREPDVFFEFENHRIFVQCKRVLSEAAVSKRIPEAEKQLKRDLDASGDPRDCGLIAVSVSRLINPGDQILSMGSEQDIDNELFQKISALWQHVRPIWSRVKHPKIAGVLFYMATPSFVQEYDLFIAAQCATIFAIPGRSDTGLLSLLAKRITS